MRLYMLFVVTVLAMVALFLVSACGLDALDGEGAAQDDLNGPSVVLINIDGELPQFHVSPDFLEPPHPSQQEIEELLKKAQNDPMVQELIVHFGVPKISFARAGELADALKRFAAGGKPLTCHIDSADNVTYWMAARACPRILVSPAGSVDAIGLAMEQIFLKDLLDSIGFEADILSVGKYKSAAEPLTRTGFSPASREALEALLGGISEAFTQGIAEGRKLDPTKVKMLIDGAPYGAADAVKLGLADQVIPLGAHLDVVREKYAGGIVDDYGKTPSKPLELADLMKLFGDHASGDVATSAPIIAVVPAIGPISSGSSGDSMLGGMEMILDGALVQTLGELARNDGVKGVVIRIDSPGGSALASDNIWHAVRALAKKKPVVASMGEVAASGGYYIASAATETFASPTTITGSIGVIGGKMVMAGGAEKVGIKSDRIQFGKTAGIMSPFTPFGPEGRRSLQQVMNKMYSLFIDRVVEGRELPREKVEELAQGRVWTGKKAIEFGLVNHSGGLFEAIQRTRELANVAAGTPAEIYPEPKTFFEVLGETLGNSRVSALHGLANRYGATRHSLALVSLLERESVLAFSPFYFNVQ